MSALQTSSVLSGMGELVPEFKELRKIVADQAAMLARITANTGATAETLQRHCRDTAGTLQGQHGPILTENA